MKETEYKYELVKFFKSGLAQETEWNAMADVLYEWGESPISDELDIIHLAMFGPPVTCDDCGSPNTVPHTCWGCDADLKAKWDAERRHLPR